MASRPFATINVALEADEEPPDLIGGNVKVSVFFVVFILIIIFFSAETVESTGLTATSWRLPPGGATLVSQSSAAHRKVTNIPAAICSTAPPVSFQVTCRVGWRQEGASGDGDDVDVGDDDEVDEDDDSIIMWRVMSSSWREGHVGEGLCSSCSPGTPLS